jgi:hypothetical protein
MSNSELDRIPVNQLSERYNLARSAVYKRMEVLGIRPKRVGNKAYITADDLLLLDDLHEFIQTGGTAAEFLDMRGLGKNSPPESSSGLSTGQPPDIVRLVAAIASEIAARFQPPVPDPDPLAYFEALERACQNGWLLSTSEISLLLDLSPEEIRSYGTCFTEAGFVFTHAGYRARGESAWKITKLPERANPQIRW